MQVCQSIGGIFGVVKKAKHLLFDPITRLSIEQINIFVILSVPTHLLYYANLLNHLSSRCSVEIVLYSDYFLIFIQLSGWKPHFACVLR